MHSNIFVERKKKMAKKIKKHFLEIIQRLKGKGFIEIILSTTLVKAIMFLSAMLLPRFLPRQDYGTLSYAETMINYYLMLTGLGLSQATMKFCTSETDPQKKNSIFGSTLVIGTAFNALAAIVFFCIILVSQFEIPDTRRLTLSMIGIPFLSFIFQDFQFYLRAHFENKKYALISVIYTFLYVGTQIALAVLVGVYGVVFARYLAYPICIVLCIYFSRKLFSFRFRWLPAKEIKRILLFSITLLMGSFFSLAVLNNETLFIGNYFKDPETIANFKVSTFFIQICVFFADAIAVFIVPYFAKNINRKKWLFVNFKKIYFYTMMLMTAVVVFLAVTSKWIVLLIWGDQYLSSTKLVRVLLVAAWCQTTLRSVPMNVLAFIGEEKYTVAVHIITCIMHAGVDYLLFRYFGESSIGFGLIFAYALSGLAMTAKAWRKLKRDAVAEAVT